MPRPALAAALVGLVLASAPSAFAAGKSKGEAPEESYLRIPALAAGVALTGGRRGVILVEPGVDAQDPALRLRVDASVPRLRAAYFAVLQRYAAGLRPGRTPDADLIARQMQAETDRVLGRGGATFLIGSVLVH